MKLETIKSQNTDIYFASFDPKKYDLAIAHALDGGIGREDILSIATRHNAIAAINGSFWESGGKLNGVPAFLRKIKNDLFISKHEYPIAYFSKSGNVEFAHINTAPHIIIGTKKLDCTINMPQHNAEIIVYTKAYTNSTLSNPGTFEATVIDNKITHISSNGNSIIPDNGFVISSKSFQGEIGAKVELETSIPTHIQEADYIISGSNMLLMNGKLDAYLTDPKHAGQFRDTPHARSALCKLQNGNIALAATDYVYEDDIKNMVPKQILTFLVSNGISREDAEKMSTADVMKFYYKISQAQNKAKGLALQDFAAALQSYGCIDAINLDGGSSTTLIYKNEVIAGSKPKLQEDADAIIVRAKK